MRGRPSAAPSRRAAVVVVAPVDRRTSVVFGSASWSASRRVEMVRARVDGTREGGGGHRRRVVAAAAAAEARRSRYTRRRGEARGGGAEPTQRAGGRRQRPASGERRDSARRGPSARLRSAALEGSRARGVTSPSRPSAPLRPRRRETRAADRLATAEPIPPPRRSDTPRHVSSHRAAERSRCHTAMKRAGPCATVCGHRPARQPHKTSAPERDQGGGVRAGRAPALVLSSARRPRRERARARRGRGRSCRGRRGTGTGAAPRGTPSTRCRPPCRRPRHGSPHTRTRRTTRRP